MKVFRFLHRRFAIRRLTFRRFTIATFAGAIAAGLWIRWGPLPRALLSFDGQPSIVVVDRHGERLYEARSADGTRQQTIDAAALPVTLVQATIAAEDVRFRSHIGLDPVALVRAFVRDVRAMRVVEGGSTITQQVAKLLIARQARLAGQPAQQRGWLAKIREAVIALRLEHRLTKDQILALYLNLAPYGNQIEGAARASQAYFGRAAATLTPAESAFLAALPQQPARYNPWRNPAGARKRQLYVLGVMTERGWLSKIDADTARAERLSFSHDPTTLIAPHFVERVLASVESDHPRRVETTLDATLQRTVAGIIAAHRKALDDHHASNVAVVVLDNRAGEWLAWEGSGNYFDQDHGGTIDGVISPRQPGSALKPFTYASAFERGASPGHVLADVPSQFPTAEAGVLYSPRNYDGRFRGPLLARAALAGSENVPAVALANDVGVPAIAHLLRQAGFSTLGNNAAHYGLGLTLGNAEVRLDELVAAYAMFARGGDYSRPVLVRAVDGAQTPRPSSERLVSTCTAFWITDILADADARAYIFGRGGSLEFPFTVAAKTGTSQAYHDNWAIGYTKDVTVGVWVGNFDRTPLRDSSGVTGAGPIFHEVMLAAVERVHGSLPIGDDSPIVAPTPDVHRVDICAMSGEPASDVCPTRVTEWLSADAAAAACTWHHASDAGVITVWPVAFRSWAQSAGLLTGPSPSVTEIQPSADDSSRGPHAADSALTIIQPLAGALYLYDPTLRSEYQALPLRARGAEGTLEWFVDGTRVGTTGGDDNLRWPLVRGSHAVTVRDQSGRTASTRIVVR